MNADAIFTLDFNSYKRIEKLGEIVAASKAVKVLIDHHQQPDKFAKLVLHNVKACSTCELIYDLIVGLGNKKLIDKKISCIIARGSITETMEHLTTAFDEKYITNEELSTGEEKCEIVFKLTNGYIAYLDNSKNQKPVPKPRPAQIQYIFVADPFHCTVKNRSMNTAVIK